MIAISKEELETVTGGNAMGNGQTGDSYRPNPNDPGTDPSTDPRNKGSFRPFGSPQGESVGGWPRTPGLGGLQVGRPTKPFR